MVMVMPRFAAVLIGSCALIGATAVRAECSPGSVTLMGANPEPSHKTPADGRDVQLSAAIVSTLPVGWTSRSPGVPDTKVSWPASLYWVDALRTFARQSGTCADIDVAAKVVAFHVAQPASVASVATKSSAMMPAIDDSLLLETSATSKKATAASAPAAQQTAWIPPSQQSTPRASPPKPAQKNDIPAAPPPSAEVLIASSHDATPISVMPEQLSGALDAAATPRFELRIGDTLHGALDRWTQQAGYTLVWRAQVDYSVEAPYAFAAGTPFNDAVRQTMGSFWARTQWLTATLYRNHVLVVSGRTAL